MTDPVVTVNGHVQADVAGSSTVVFTGVISRTVVTDANGDFTFTCTPSALGRVTGTAWDSSNAISNIAKSSVVSMPPYFSTFTVTEGSNNIWTFSGTVTNEEVNSLWVSFTGLACLYGVTADVDAAGNFSIGVCIAEGTSGTIVAHVTDCWGLNGSATTVI